MGLERKLPVWKPDSKFFSELKILTRERYALVSQKTAVTNRTHAIKYAEANTKKTIARLKKFKNFLKQEIKEVEEEIELHLKSDELVWQKTNAVLQTPGIGLTTAAVLLAETDGFQKTTSVKRLVAFSGYKITVNESGLWKGKSKISKRGNKYIRHALHMPILSVIQCNPILSEKYQKLKARKEKPIVATTAIERKTLVIIYSIYKNNKPFDPNYKKNKIMK